MLLIVLIERPTSASGDVMLSLSTRNGRLKAASAMPGALIERGASDVRVHRIRAVLPLAIVHRDFRRKSEAMLWHGWRHSLHVCYVVSLVCSVYWNPSTFPYLGFGLLAGLRR